MESKTNKSMDVCITYCTPTPSHPRLAEMDIIFFNWLNPKIKYDLFNQIDLIGKFVKLKC